MTEPVPPRATELLRRFGAGETQAASQLLPLVYEELRRLAEGHMRQERPDHTLQPTALLHEAYVRLVDVGEDGFEGRRQFFALASQVMRRLLVDHARRRNAEKRGGGLGRITLGEETDGPAEPVDVLALDDALEGLEELDPDLGEIARLRLFGGLEVKELAAHLDRPLRTVERRWRTARLWLQKELADD